MKNLTKIFMAVAVAMFAFSCVNDATEDIAVKVGGKTTLAISLDDTRTELGEKEDGVYPVTWSTGDQITVNGVTSNPLTFADGAGTANAVFTFNTESLATPYCVAYPAADEGYVVFAPEQIHNNNGTTFDNGAATMYGYSNGGRVKLNHLTGVLKIGVVGNATLKSATISTIDRDPIAGPFAIDFTTGALTPSENATNTIVYQFAGMDGLYLDETEPTYLHIAVPAGTYDELYVTLVDDQGGMMYATVKAGDNKPLAAGKVREFTTPITYAPISSDDVFIVKDYESLLAFTEAAKAATVDNLMTKDAVFVNDIDMSGKEWTQVEMRYYRGTIHGNGHVIKGLNASLFARVGGVIKGLHLEDVNISRTGNSYTNSGALTCMFYGTCVTHCSASGTISCTDINGTSYAKRIGGLIGVIENTDADVEISNCINRCNIEIGCTHKNSNIPTIGGIYGQVNVDSTHSLTIKNNVNEGNITLTGTTYSSSRTGGIMGHIGRFSTMMVEGCVNKGAISFCISAIQSSARHVSVGGVIGIVDDNGKDNDSFTIRDCHNIGTVTVDSEQIKRGISEGGIVGNVALSGASNFTIEKCTNTETITMDIENCVPYGNTLTPYLNSASGIVGLLNITKNANITIKETVNSGKIISSGYSVLPSDTKDNAATYVLAAGIIANIKKADNITPTCTFDKLTNTGDIDVMIENIGINGDGSYFGGIVSNPMNFVFTNAKNYGTLKVYQTKEDGTYGTYANAGMLAGSASATFTNSAVGGTFVYGNGAELTSVELTADNYAKYLFSNRDLTEYAGVSLLTSAPAAN